MNISPKSTHLLALVRAKASACADKAGRAGATGAEWQRQAGEWADFAAELQKYDELAPLLPAPFRRRF